MPWTVCKLSDAKTSRSRRPYSIKSIGVWPAIRKPRLFIGTSAKWKKHRVNWSVRHYIILTPTKRKKRPYNLFSFLCDFHFRTQDLEIAKAESRNGRAFLERDDLEKEVQERAKELEEKEGQVAVKDGQIKRLEAELNETQKLLERKEAHLVRQKTTLEELRATLEKNEDRTEEERVLRLLHQQLDQVRRDTESLQRQWSDAEQLLLSVAMARDHQSVQEEKLREGEWDITLLFWQ